MKYVPLLSLFILAGCAPKSYKNYHKSTNQFHPPLVHKMEQTLASHSSDSDSVHSQWASDFWTGFEGEFESYKPKKSVIYELFAIIQKQHIKVSVIGGNWCSDTKTQVPRLCKVLHLAGLNDTDYSYYQVDKTKHQILSPGELHRTDEKPSKVPTVTIEKDGKVIRKIIETPTKSWESDILQILQ